MNQDEQIKTMPPCQIKGCKEKGICYFYTRIVCGQHAIELTKKLNEKNEKWIEEMSNE